MPIPFKIKILLWYLKLNKGTKLEHMTAEQARISAAKVESKASFLLDYDPIPLNRVFDLDIPGRSGNIPIRIYQPVDQPDLPIVLFFHGGGFVLNDLDTHDKICRRISRDSEVVVIAVDYRRGPEHPYPAAPQDAYDALLWVAENRETHGGDSLNISTMGDSAGGNLATVVCLMSRDLKGPKISKQILLYPCTDATLSHPSIDTFGEGYLLTRNIIQWFLVQYLSNPEEDVYDPYVSPLFAESLENLPPAFVCTAGYDPLKDEGKKYAERLEKEGNEVVFKNYEGLIHSFFGMPKMAKEILVCYEEVSGFLRK